MSDVNITDYLKISDNCKSINSTYVSSDTFKTLYEILTGFERKSLISHVIVNNTPYIFQDMPLLYEQIIQYMSELLDIEPYSIKLIGSAKTGFSVSPPPEYGKAFSEKSDLDFTIISEIIFDMLRQEFKQWENAYCKNHILPRNHNEKYFWDNNMKEIPRNIERGFIDAKRIPTIEMCPVTCIIRNAMYLIPFKLKEFYNIKIREKNGASVRVYKNHDSFLKQLEINTNKILK